jgi:polyribonucleotide nucleotidyltransferase
VASSDADGLARAIQMISDITAVPEVGKTYLGKVVRLAEFGAFVEIFPGTDGLLHVSEIAEHRVKEVKDELREGDQILVKVLSIEGNRIKLSRKAVLREQRAKLGLPEPGQAASSDYPAPLEQDDEEDGDDTVLVEGGVDFDDDDTPDSDSGSDSDEPNFNRADGAPVPAVAAGGRGPGGAGGGFRGPGGPGGPGGDRRPGGRRRRGGGGGGRRPGGPGGGGGQGGGNR